MVHRGKPLALQILYARHGLPKMHEKNFQCSICAKQTHVLLCAQALGKGGENMRRRSESREGFKDERLFVRIAPQDKAKLRERCKRSSIALSEFIREAIREALNNENE